MNIPPSASKSPSNFLLLQMRGENTISLGRPMKDNFGGNEFRELVERLNHVSSGGQNAFRHLLKSPSLSLAVDRSEQASELALYWRIRNERERQELHFHHLN